MPNQQSRPDIAALRVFIDAALRHGVPGYRADYLHDTLHRLVEQYENLLTGSSPMSDGAQRAMQALEIENAELKEQLEAAARERDEALSDLAGYRKAPRHAGVAIRSTASSPAREA